MDRYTPLFLAWAGAAALFLASQPLPAAEDLPLNGISHVTFRVSDLEKARGFYTGVLGFPQCFDLKKKDGSLFLIVLKVNDDQYIEILPNLKPGENERMTHISLVTASAESLYQSSSSAVCSRCPCGRRAVTARARCN
ncbi:MAG TPA: VOC family protein [Bryobacteraceae bacterium]|nr:VOC family protein [Bryobacteraceae bacterium]